jgi:hypothetical protein
MLGIKKNPACTRKACLADVFLHLQGHGLVALLAYMNNPCFPLASSTDGFVVKVKPHVEVNQSKHSQVRNSYVSTAP